MSLSVGKFTAFDMNNRRHILVIKFESVIEEISKQRKISLRSALDVLYNSKTYREMSDGIADMHCRSDIYLADEIDRETA